MFASVAGYHLEWRRFNLTKPLLFLFIQDDKLYSHRITKNKVHGNTFSQTTQQQIGFNVMCLM